MAKKEKEVAEKKETPKPDVTTAKDAQKGQTYGVVGLPGGLSLKK